MSPIVRRRGERKLGMESGKEKRDQVRSTKEQIRGYKEKKRKKLKNVGSNKGRRPNWSRRIEIHIQKLIQIRVSLWTWYIYRLFGQQEKKIQKQMNPNMSRGKEEQVILQKGPKIEQIGVGHLSENMEKEYEKDGRIKGETMK